VLRVLWSGPPPEAALRATLRTEAIELVDGPGNDVTAAVVATPARAAAPAAPRAALPWVWLTRGNVSHEDIATAVA
jgi:hypothetical protein